MSERYAGQIEYAGGAECAVEIDDLDAPSWLGTLAGPFLHRTGVPNPWFVGVTLLEGPRAGQVATADLSVEPSDVRFQGREPFMPTN